jgi:membrane-bound ClpP family serine protease
MEIAIIASLIIFGVILFLLEMFLIPGISIAGVGVVIAFIAAIVYAYTLSSLHGTIALIIGVLLSGLLIWIFLRGKTLDRMSLKTSVDSKVDALQGLDVKEGDTGVASSRLAPMGKVKVNGQIVEAKTDSVFVDEGTEVVVLKVFSNNVLVAPVIK